MYWYCNFLKENSVLKHFSELQEKRAELFFEYFKFALMRSMATWKVSGYKRQPIPTNKIINCLWKLLKKKLFQSHIWYHILCKKNRREMKELIDEVLPYFQHVNTKKAVAISCGIFVFGILFGYLIFPLTLKALIANVSKKKYWLI